MAVQHYRGSVSLSGDAGDDIGPIGAYRPAMGLNPLAVKPVAEEAAYLRFPSWRVAVALNGNQLLRQCENLLLCKTTFHQLITDSLERRAASCRACT